MLERNLDWSHHASSRRTDHRVHDDAVEPAAEQKDVSPADVDPADPKPVQPIEPDAADCCGEGCVRCVFDVYDEALERYEAALAAWRSRHP